jgi:hypothetical protein
MTDADGRASNKLERADLGQASQGLPLHNHIGRRLRNIFPAPNETEDAFDSLLKEISSRLP